MRCLAAFLFLFASLAGISFSQDKIDLPRRAYLSNGERIIAGDALRKMWDASFVKNYVGNPDALKKLVIDKGVVILEVSSFSEYVSRNIKLFYSYAIDAFLVIEKDANGTNAYWINPALIEQLANAEPIQNSPKAMGLLFVARAGMAQLMAKGLQGSDETKAKILGFSADKENGDAIIARIVTAIESRHKFLQTGCLEPILRFLESNQNAIAKTTGVTINLVESLQPTMPARFREGDAMFFTDSIMGRFHFAVHFDEKTPGCAPKEAGFMFSVWTN